MGTPNGPKNMKKSLIFHILTHRPLKWPLWHLLAFFGLWEIFKGLQGQCNRKMSNWNQNMVSGVSEQNFLKTTIVSGWSASWNIGVLNICFVFSMTSVWKSDVMGNFSVRVQDSAARAFALSYSGKARKAALLHAAAMSRFCSLLLYLT